MKTLERNKREPVDYRVWIGTQWRCNACKSEFEIESEKDFKKHNEYTGHVFVRCSECGDNRALIMGYDDGRKLETQ